MSNAVVGVDDGMFGMFLVAAIMVVFILLAVFLVVVVVYDGLGMGMDTCYTPVAQPCIKVVVYGAVYGIVWACTHTCRVISPVV